MHTVVSGGTDGKRKEFGKFRCILSSQGGRWEAWCVRGHVAERVEERTSIGHGDLPAKSVAGVCQKQDVQKMKYLSQ